MPFAKGHTGRPKGFKNKGTRKFLEVLEANKFCPASALIQCYKESKTTYDNYATIFKAICDAREVKGLFPIDDKADKYLKMAIECAKELARYTYPHQKAIEYVEPKVLNNWTDEEKLEAYEQQAERLRQKINAAKPTS